MDLWKILVFGVVKQSLDCDYDRLENLANNHRQVRAMLGLDEHWEEVTYESRTIARNVDLLSRVCSGRSTRSRSTRATPWWVTKRGRSCRDGAIRSSSKRTITRPT